MNKNIVSTGSLSNNEKDNFDVKQIEEIFFLTSDDMSKHTKCITNTKIILQRHNISQTQRFKLLRRRLCLSIRPCRWITRPDIKSFHPLQNEVVDSI